MQKRKLLHQHTNRKYVCMYVCTHVRTYIHHMHTKQETTLQDNTKTKYVCLYAYMYIDVPCRNPHCRVSTKTYVCMYVCMHIRIYMCHIQTMQEPTLKGQHKNLCMYVFMYVCMHTRIYMCHICRNPHCKVSTNNYSYDNF